MMQLEPAGQTLLEALAPQTESAPQHGSAVPFDAQLGGMLATLLEEDNAEPEALEQTLVQLAAAGSEQSGARVVSAPDARIEDVEATAPRLLAHPQPERPTSTLASLPPTPPPVSTGQEPALRDAPQVLQAADALLPKQKPETAGAEPTRPAPAIPTSQSLPASELRGIETGKSLDAARLPQVQQQQQPQSQRRAELAGRPSSDRIQERATQGARDVAEPIWARPELGIREADRSVIDGAPTPSSNTAGHSNAAGTSATDAPANALIGSSFEAIRTDAVARDTAIPAPVPARAIPEHVQTMATSGGGTARLRLHPASLGEVEITVVLRGGAVDIVMRAEEPAAEMALIAQRDVLGESLGSRELRMENFDVLSSRSGSASDDGQGFREPATSGQHDRGDRRPDSREPQLSQAASATSQPDASPIAESASSQRIDLRI